MNSVLLGKENLICNGKEDCSNTNLDEAHCTKERFTLPSGIEIPKDEVCDDKCADDCEDEATCNGYTYGLYCKVDPTNYILPYQICDGENNCDDGEDEATCDVSHDTESVCIHNKTSKLVPVHNYTRCARFPGGKMKNKFYCSDVILSQSNCSDHTKVELSCEVNGYMSHVSRYMICGRQEHSACDDGIDKLCFSPSLSCKNLHKHYFCDGKNDCHDKSDETRALCNKTVATCERRVGSAGELPVPLAWLADGVEDCFDGRDERQIWPTCGVGKTHRFVTSYVTCENVFICLSGTPGYVEMTDLCDGIETCGNENEICSKSRNTHKPATSVLSYDKDLTKRLSFCLKGIYGLQPHNLTCTSEHFIFPDHEFYGVDTKTKLILPKSLQNCDFMYGEQYLYTSCTNSCINSPCPLKNVPRYEVCPDQYPKRVGTLANNEYLAFFTRSFGNIYTNRYFVCDNKAKCIDYSQVCDLVDDCGDGSDEDTCTNHFQCNSSGHYLPKTKKCDGHFDCLDYSDECNDHCSRQILQGNSLKIMAWTIGILAGFANLVILVKHISSFKQCRNIVVLINKSFIILISFGDLSIGCYLVIISVYDSLIFKEEYCHNQINWITSTECSFIGVLSTLGSQLSLFSMTGLSIVRIYVILNSNRTSGRINILNYISVAAAILLVIMVALSIAVIPIIEAFEDFFVNGISFPNKTRIFIGTTEKKTVIHVLEAYHGRMADTIGMTWKNLLELVSSIYSHDFNYDDHTSMTRKVHFYGNDGVCLFKYFVDSDDPQKLFVWSILAVNFLCFLFISTSYLLIHLITSRSSNSSGNQQDSERMNKMNRKIAFIITTDFICWIPFIVICTLHSLEVLNATPWYSLFSIIILPINSLINPFLYDDFLTNLALAPIKSLKTIILNSTALQKLRSLTNVTQVDTIELEQIEVNTENAV